MVTYRLVGGEGGHWMREQEMALDGPVTALLMEPQLHEGVAATGSATVWCAPRKIVSCQWIDAKSGGDGCASLSWFDPE